MTDLGSTSLFLGVYTVSWSLSDFQAAARNAKSLGVSTLLVKIADGVFEWYRNIGGWQVVLDAIESQGVHAVPYTYSYGNKYGGLQGEIQILKDAISVAGIAIADMEVEWNGQVGWASVVANALAGRSGKFGVTTWADPDLQNWQGVIANLKGCVDFWLPQVYTDYLASVYQAQMAGLPLVPVLNLGIDVGPNDIMATAKSAKTPAISFWEYQGAIGGYTTIVKGIVALFPGNQGGQDMPLQITDSFAAAHFTETSATSWHCKDNGIDVHGSILAYYRKTQGAMRLPRTPEIAGIIPGGVMQIFEGGVLAWDPQYKLDNPGQGDVYAMHLDSDTPGLRRLIALAGLSVPGITEAEVNTVITAIKAAQAGLAVALSDLEPVTKAS